MKRGRIYSITFLLGSVALMLGIGVLNYVLTRKNLLTSHAHWVERVSSRLMAERLSNRHSLRNLAERSHDEIRRELFSMPDFAGAYWFDVHTHEYERWVDPAYERALKAPDPRLVVAQLKATETHTTQIGPVLTFKGALLTSVAQSIDRRHAIVVIQDSPYLKKILEEESAWAHLQAFVFDSDHHLLYMGGNLAPMVDSLRDTLDQAQSGIASGFMPLNHTAKWRRVATYHKAADSDWVFILSESIPFVYYPILLYLGSLLCVLWLASIPWKAADSLRRVREGAELRQFAVRVENFVRGKEMSLNEPPYPFNDLLPIVHSLRWLMPQWKKAEAYPTEFGLERKLLSLLIESLPEGILFFNSQGALQLGNELGKVFLALQQDKGREFKMVKGLQVPRGFLEPFVEPVFAGEQPNLGKEIEVGWADGKHLYRVWVEAVDVDDKVEGFIVVVRDITFRKQWEYVQEQVLSGITHDLRGPLSAIMGYLDLLKRQLKEGPAKALDYVGLAREAGTRLTQMISDILDVVRFEQGKIDIDIQAVRVEDLFERVRNIFGVTAGQKSVVLKLVMAKGGIKAYCDKKLLERVFDNLVGNAIKFTPTGGTITVTAEREAKRTVFSVADTGRGIPKEAQSRVFDKFQQVRPGDRSTGYGLGLAVVKFIVDAHKGEIRLKSELDKGSTFTFWIPDQPVSVREEASREASAGESARS